MAAFLPDSEPVRDSCVDIVMQAYNRRRDESSVIFERAKLLEHLNIARSCAGRGRMARDVHGEEAQKRLVRRSLERLADMDWNSQICRQAADRL